MVHACQKRKQRCSRRLEKRELFLGRALQSQVVDLVLISKGEPRIVTFSREMTCGLRHAIVREVKRYSHFLILILSFAALAFSSVGYATGPARSEATCIEHLLGGELESKILKTIEPAFGSARAKAEQLPAAQTIDELQNQIQTLLDDPSIENLYIIASRKLDLMAPPLNIVGPFGLSNFAQVVPGVFRSANPTLEQATALVQSGTIDAIISLNYELDLLSQLDGSHDEALTDARRAHLLAALKARGLTEERALSEIRFYERHMSYAQAATHLKMPYHTYYRLNHPRNELEGFFAAVKQILEMKRAGKKVLFHCSIGKHRTGFVALLVKAVSLGRPPTQAELDQLNVEFIEYNWNSSPVTRLHYTLFLPLIFKSVPFRDLISSSYR